MSTPSKHPRTIAWTGLQDAFDNMPPGSPFTVQGLAKEAEKITGYRPEDQTARRFIREALDRYIYDTGTSKDKRRIYRKDLPKINPEPTPDSILGGLHAIRAEIAALRRDVAVLLMARAS